MGKFEPQGIENILNRTARVTFQEHVSFVRLTITELIARYWRFAKGYYVKEGNPTSEIHAIRLALRFVHRLYGNTAACEFSPKKLKAVREAMVVHEIARDVKVTDEATGKPSTVRKVIRKGLARKCINKLVGRVKRMFAWAVEEELVPVAVHAALARVKGLKKGKSAARDPRRSVGDRHCAGSLGGLAAMRRRVLGLVPGPRRLEPLAQRRRAGCRRGPGEGIRGGRRDARRRGGGTSPSIPGSRTRRGSGRDR